MEGISAGISQILILAIVVVLGFILSKLSYLDEHTSNKLVGILVNVTLPCMIIASTSQLISSKYQRKFRLYVDLVFCCL